MTKGDFMLVELKDAGIMPVYDGDGQLLTFATGTEADRAASKWTTKLGNKVQPRRINDANWRERERTRLLDGTYRPLPWSDRKWWTELNDIHKDHFPHISVQKQVLIAYTESKEKGVADIQTPIKPGRYLEKFFKDKIDEHAIRELCCVIASKFETQDLIVTFDPDEIEEIYLTGPSSCMSKPKESYGTPVHPTRAYGGTNLALAYLRRKGRVVARCVVWPEKKLHNTIYGDAALMTTVLKKEGYKLGSMAGAKMMKIPHRVNAQEGVYVIPHVDGIAKVRDLGNHLELLSGGGEDADIQVNNGAGKSELMAICPICIQTRVKRIMKPLIVMGQGEKRVCAECIKGKAVRCELTERWYLVEQTMEVSDGRRKYRVGQDLIGNGDIAKCDGTGAWFLSSSLLRLVDGRRWCVAYAKGRAAECKCGLWREENHPCCIDRAKDMFVGGNLPMFGDSMGSR